MEIRDEPNFGSEDCKEDVGPQFGSDKKGCEEDGTLKECLSLGWVNDIVAKMPSG